jgi:hypothetical protein
MACESDRELFVMGHDYAAMFFPTCILHPVLLAPPPQQKN